MKKLTFVLIILSVLLLTACETIDIKVGLNPGVDVVEINETWIDAGAYLSAGETYTTSFSSDVVDTNTLGEYEIEYGIVYDDEEYTITRMVMVIDETAPVLTILEGVDTIALNDAWTDGGCTVIDNSGETLACSTDSVVDTSTAGEYEVIYYAEDSSENEGTIIRIVTVIE